MNAQIALTAGVTATLFGGVYLWLRDRVRRFDQKYGHTCGRRPGK